MKKTLFILIAAIASFSANAGTYYFAWDGYGFATKHNYGLTYGYGLYQYKAVGQGIGVGFQEMVQKYDLYYDNDRGSAYGSSTRLTVSYYYLSPMAVFQLGRRGQTQCYITGGVGMASSGVATQHKWSTLAWSPAGGVYDSIIDRTESINPIMIRGGFGFAHFYHLGGNFHLFLNEDLGFVATPMLKNTEVTDAQISSSAPQKFQPIFISLRFGITFIPHSRDWVNPYRIRR